MKKYSRGDTFRSSVVETDGGFWNSMPGEAESTFAVGSRRNGSISYTQGLKVGKEYEFKITDSFGEMVLVKPVQRSITELSSDISAFVDFAKRIGVAQELGQRYVGLTKRLEGYAWDNEKELKVLTKFLTRLEEAFNVASQRIIEDARYEEIRKKWLEGLVVEEGKQEEVERMKEISAAFLKQTTKVPFDLRSNLADFDVHLDRTLVGRLGREVVACLSYEDPTNSLAGGIRLTNLGTDPQKPGLINSFLQRAGQLFPEKKFYVVLNSSANYPLFRDIGFVKGPTFTVKNVRGKILESNQVYRFDGK
jgi:hypothetical protein